MNYPAAELRGISELRTSIDLKNQRFLKLFLSGDPGAELRGITDSKIFEIQEQFLNFFIF